jgi:hypothetical protein
MKTILAFILVFLAIPFTLFAQSVTTSPLSDDTVCAGSTITVNYTASGTFGAKNVFSAQLSAADGSFSPSFQIIGSVKSTTSGSISATFNVPAGTHYRVRVTSSNPYIVGSDNGSDITVGALQQVRCQFEGNYGSFLVGDSIRLYPFLNATIYPEVAMPGCSFSWDFGGGANPATSSDSAVYVTYGTTGTKTISVTATTPLGCSRSNADSVTTLNIYDCSPAIPSDVIIDSVDASADNAGELFRGSKDIWVVPGGILNAARYSGRTIYVEAGGSVLNAEGDVIYLKDGATVSGASGSVLIHSPGAGLTNTQWADPLLCQSLAFDYTDAPPYKIIPVHAGVSSTGQTDPDFSVYPNPATNLVNIEANEIPQSISVRNELGKEMLNDNGPLVTSRIEFDVSRFADGVYYVELALRGTKEKVKFTIAR